MKCTFNAGKLKEAIGILSKVTPDRPTHAVLGLITLEKCKEEDMVVLSAFDLTTGLSIKIPVTSLSMVGEAHLLPTKELAEITNKLDKEEEITIAINEEDLSLEIIIKHGRFKMSTIDPEERVSFPKITSENINYFSPENFKEGLKTVAFSASKDETKQLLTGIKFKTEEGRLIYQATDGHRLAVYGMPVTQLDTFTEDIDTIIPSKSLQLLDPIIKSAMEIQTDVPMSLVFDTTEPWVQISAGDYTFVSRVLDGAYPVVERLFPLTYSSEFSLNVTEMIKKLELVAIAADSKENTVIISFDETYELKVKGHEQVALQKGEAVVVAGGPCRIGLNIKYLLEALRNIKNFTDRVYMGCNEPNQPVVFSVGGDNPLKYLLMPVQIRE
jgi:DNA polymerase-3 subunit beta